MEYKIVQLFEFKLSAWKIDVKDYAKWLST